MNLLLYHCNQNENDLNLESKPEIRFLANVLMVASEKIVIVGDIAQKQVH